MQIKFTHRQSAHCESGVTSNLLTFYGHPISEALTFGIGGGLFFGYFPFIKWNRLPLVTFRSYPGAILKKCARRLGVKIKTQKFRNPEQSMQALDAGLKQGVPMGLQTGAFWLPYFPPALRFHFNTHNIVVFGYEGDNYLISDPVFGQVVSCAREDLMRARFAKGSMAPKGRMYSLAEVPKTLSLRPAIQKGICEVANRMIRAPMPLFGIRGIKFLARQLQHWPKKLGEKRATLHLGHIIRMQEEIGTGGAGFRFIYAAFLQEAADMLDKPGLVELALEMTEIGDLWRQFALRCARNCKGRGDSTSSYPALADLLCECAAREKNHFQKILQEVS